MPDPVMQISFAGEGFSNSPVNSTITQSWRPEEALFPHTSRAEPILPNVNASLSACIRPVTISASAPQVQENPFEASTKTPTAVLPEAISANWKNLAGGGLTETTYHR